MTVNEPPGRLVAFEGSVSTLAPYDVPAQLPFHDSQFAFHVAVSSPASQRSPSPTSFAVMVCMQKVAVPRAVMSGQHDSLLERRARVARRGRNYLRKGR